MKIRILSIILTLVFLNYYTVDVAAVVSDYSNLPNSQQEILKSVKNIERIDVLSFTDANKVMLIGKISQVMNYKNGQLAAVQHRDGSIDVYDGGGYRATISETDDGKGYKYVRFQINASDVNIINSMHGLVEFLNQLGFSQAQISEIQRINQGGDLGDKNTLMDWLKSSGNSAVTLSLTDNGVSARLVADGKDNVELTGNGSVKAEWVYDSNGYLKQYVLFQSKARVSGDNGNEYQVVVTDYGSGKEIQTWTADLITGQDGQKDIIDTNSKVITTEYGYFPDGSKQYERNVLTGDTTYFSSGRQTYTTNSKGSLKMKYTYSYGGTLQSYIEYVDGVASKMSVLSEKGKLIGSGIPNDDTLESEQQLRQELVSIRYVIDSYGVTPEEIERILYTKSHITSISIYPQDFDNSALMMVLFLNEQQQQEVEEVMNGSQFISFDQAINTLAAQENASSENPEDKIYLSIKSFLEAARFRNQIVTVEIRQGVEDPRKRETGNTRQELHDKRSAGAVEGRTHGSGSRDGEGVTDTDDLYTEESGQGQYAVEVETFKEYILDTDHTLTFTMSIKDKEGNTVIGFSNKRVAETTNSEAFWESTFQTMYYDPAVIGKAQSFTDADGNAVDEAAARQMIIEGKQVFIKLYPKSVNMFDGAGFQDIVEPKDGEEIFVKVEDMDMFDAFKGVIGTDASVMVVGMVTNDMAGKMTMQVYNSTNGTNIGFGLESTANKGYAIGEQLNAMKDEIDKLAGQENSWVVKNTKTNQIIFANLGLTNSGGYLNDWKAGWAALARLMSGGK